MTVRDLFSVIDTYNPRIFIYDANDPESAQVYSKFSNRPVAKCNFLDHEIVWIYRVDCLEVSIKIIV